MRFMVLSGRGIVMDNHTCPVCGMEMEDKGVTVDMGGGQKINVCCDDCATKAKDNPAMYAGAKK